MIKTVSFFCFAFLSYEGASAQLPAAAILKSSVPKPDHHYQEEYTFDKPVNEQAWRNQKKGLNVSFGSTDALYMRTEVPLTAPTLSWQESAWKGERLNAQILVWSPDTVDQVRFIVSDLTAANGKTISKDNITLQMVRYVLSNFPYGATNAECDARASDTAYLMPDRFEALERFSVPGNSVRPVWMTINVPSDAAEGTYNGTIQVSSENNNTSLQVRVNVQKQVLPKPSEWKYRLDLWQNPWVVAWYYDLEPWSDEHKALLKKHLKIYADAGGTYITTYAVHSPWSDNSYMIEGTMIDWVKQKDGKWKFDYNIFDQYVELAMECGVTRAITIYTPVPWGHRFRYMDEATGNYVHVEWSPETEEFRKFWKIFLDDLKGHLEQKGWFNKTYLGINENPLNITIAAAKFIKEHSKDWKITYAGDWHPELSSLLDDYSPIIKSEPNQKELQQRKAKGFTTTFYVCCTPPKPNNFVFSPPVEGRYISWYAAAYGYDGFLRWAYDAWPEDPMRDARHTLWPAGDCFMVYPGGNSSIRYEKMREGIVDYEKIRILREKASASSNPKAKQLLKELNDHLKTLIDNPDYSKRDYSLKKVTFSVEKGKKLLQMLSEQL
jgi:hypothetical protein